MWGYVGTALLTVLITLPAVLLIALGIGVTGGGGFLAFVTVLILMFLASALMLALGTAALPGAAIRAPHPRRAA